MVLGIILASGCAGYRAPTERQIDTNLKSLQRSEPDLHKRIVTIARQSIGQPYELYLLGEAPFETIDIQPVYCLGKSDCVVFAEHTLAMALTDDFQSFMTMLQRIRYKDGAIGVVTRNHYTEADWNVNNRWLERDITEEVGGSHVLKYKQSVDRAKFFKGRYKLDVAIPIEKIEESYIPYEKMDAVKPLLHDGDIVNFVTGKADGAWVGHVGLIAHGSDGTVHLIHSAPPKVREETIDQYIERATKDAAAKDLAGKARFRGFKFLRVHDDALARLRKLDGDAAPRVTVPADSKLSFADYLASFKL